jgi:hypothetical protein
VATETKGSQRTNPIRNQIAAAAEVLKSSGAISNRQATPEEQCFEDSVASEPQPVEGKRNPLKRQGAVVWDHDMGGSSKRSKNKGVVT